MNFSIYFGGRHHRSFCEQPRCKHRPVVTSIGFRRAETPLWRRLKSSLYLQGGQAGFFSSFGSAQPGIQPKSCSPRRST